MDAGYLREGDPFKVSNTLWAHAHGMIAIYHKGLLPIETLDDFRSEMTASFFRLMEGLGTEAWGELQGGFADVKLPEGAPA